MQATKTITFEELEEKLSNYYGTEQWHRVNPFVPSFLITDGVKAWAELCQAFWSLDIIALQLVKYNRKETFLVLEVDCNKNHTCTISIKADTNEPVIKAVKQKNYDKSMPVGTHKFYLIYDGQHSVMLLPSEY